MQLSSSLSPKTHQKNTIKSLMMKGALQGQCRLHDPALKGVRLGIYRRRYPMVCTPCGEFQESPHICTGPSKAVQKPLTSSPTLPLSAAGILTCTASATPSPARLTMILYWNYMSPGAWTLSNVTISAIPTSTRKTRSLPAMKSKCSHLPSGAAADQSCCPCLQAPARTLLDLWTGQESPVATGRLCAVLEPHACVIWQVFIY